MQVGPFGKALELLATADAGPLDESQPAWVDLLRGPGHERRGEVTCGGCIPDRGS